MCGEIRDAETAKIAAHAALTGHLLLSTIHAGTPAEVLARLSQLGVEAPLIASIVSGILAQRLLRKVCEKCGPERGCPECRGTGYSGRMLLAELLVPNDALRQALRENADLAKLSALAAASGCEGLWARGLAEVEAGTTTMEELRRVLVSE
jgi:type II secretory ATPase GspE/PulE/Tfp pilus assembly ATPase PilB-like protein